MKERSIGGLNASLRSLTIRGKNSTDLQRVTIVMHSPLNIRKELGCNIYKTGQQNLKALFAFGPVLVSWQPMAHLARMALTSSGEQTAGLITKMIMSS